MGVQRQASHCGSHSRRMAGWCMCDSTILISVNCSAPGWTIDFLKFSFRNLRLFSLVSQSFVKINSEEKSQNSLWIANLLDKLPPSLSHFTWPSMHSPPHTSLSSFSFFSFLIPCSFATAINQLQLNIQFVLLLLAPFITFLSSPRLSFQTSAESRDPWGWELALSTQTEKKTHPWEPFYFLQI